MSIDYPVTPIYSTKNSADSFTLGRPAAIQVGIENLKDGQVYDYTIVSGNKYERGSGVYSDETKTLTRTNITSSNNNQPENFSDGILINISLDGKPVAESVKVLDYLGPETREAISQRCVTDELSRRLYNQDPTNSKYKTPAKAIFITGSAKAILEGADGSEIALADEDFVNRAISAVTTNDNKVFMSNDMSNIAVGAFQAQKLSSNQVTDALTYTPLKEADLAGYLKVDFSNIDLLAFQKLALTDNQIIAALGYTPAKDSDVNGFADKNLDNVTEDDFKAKVKAVFGDIKIIQTSNVQTVDLSDDGTSLNVVGLDGKSHTVGGKPTSDDLIGALGYTPAKNDLSNVAVGTFNTKLNFPVSGEDPTVASGGANSNDKGIRNFYAKTISNGDTSKGAILPVGSVEYILWALTNSSYGTESSHKIQILTREQVEYLIKNGGSSVALVQDLNGTSTTAAPSQNAVATALQGYVSGMNGSAYSVQGIYAHNTGSGTTVGANENITVKFTNYGQHQVQVELATQPWVNSILSTGAGIKNVNGDSVSYSISNGSGNNSQITMIQLRDASFNDLGSTGSQDNGQIVSAYWGGGKTNVIYLASRSWVNDYFQPKGTCLTSANIVQNLNGTSTTAAPSQNAVATALQGYVSGVKSDGKQRAAISNLYIQNLGFNSYNSYCPTVTTKDDNGSTIQIAIMGRDAAIDHFLSKDDASATYATVAALNALTSRVAALEAKSK